MKIIFVVFSVLFSLNAFAKDFNLVDCENGRMKIVITKDGLELYLQNDNDKNTLSLPNNISNHIKIGDITGSDRDELKSIESQVPFFYIKKSDGGLIVENWAANCYHGNCTQGEMRGKVEVSQCDSKSLW